MSTVGDTMSTPGDTMSTGGCSVHWEDTMSTPGIYHDGCGIS